MSGRHCRLPWLHALTTAAVRWQWDGCNYFSSRQRLIRKKSKGKHAPRLDFKMLPLLWNCTKACERLWLELHAGEITSGNLKLSLHSGKSTPDVSQRKFSIETEVVIENYLWQLNTPIAVIQRDYVSSMQESTQVEDDSLLQQNFAQHLSHINKVTIMQTAVTSIILEPGNGHTLLRTRCRINRLVHQQKQGNFA